MDINFESLNQIHQNISYNNSQKNDTQTLNSFNFNKQNNQFRQNDNKSVLNQYDANKNSIVQEDKNKSQNSQDNQKSLLQQKLPQIDFQNNVEIGYFDEFGQDSYKMLTQIKGKRSHTQQNDFKQQQQKQPEEKCTIFKNKQSIVDIKFDSIQTDFIISKQNLDDKELFEKEYKKLELLKGSNITLDIVSTMEDNSSFQQIAGKSNLLLANQKNLGNLAFQASYFILIDKLNKMHEIGIAHSDIKPQNIVLSFNNEPYFIDFGGSIFLSDENDCKNYLNFFTPQYNLKIYFEIFNQQDKKYITKSFESKEDIKLCDMTQLSLTFLYLICENDIQKKLFLTKQYNQLLQNIIHNEQNYDKKAKHRAYTEEQYQLNKEVNQTRNMIFLFHISRILNLADPEINIIGDANEKTFEINEHIREYELKYLNDIVFQDQEKAYIIKCIDKFNQQGYRLLIDSKKIKITPLPDMKQYIHICQKYKIDEYFQYLIDGSRFYSTYKHSIFNICQYITVYQIKNLEFFDTSDNFVLKFFTQLESLKSLQSLELKFQLKLKSESFSFFITKLKEQLTIFYVEGFEIFRDEIILLKIRNDIKDIQINKKNLYDNFINVTIHSSNIDYPFEEYVEIIRTNYQIKQIEFSFQCQSTDNKKEDKYQDNQPDKYLQQIQFENQINYILIKFILFDKEQSIQNKVIIKISNQMIIKAEMWLQIQNILETKSNYYIEIMIINCQLSKSVAQSLNLIQQYNKKARYEFQDEYIEQQDKDLKYYVNVEFNVNSISEQGLKIIFCNSKVQKELHNHQNKSQITQLQDQYYYQPYLLPFVKKLGQQNIEQEIQQNISEYSENEKIQLMFQKYRKSNNLNLNKLKIGYGEQMQIQKFRFTNKIIKLKYMNDMDLTKHIESLIKDIQFKNHYENIEIYQNSDENVDYDFYNLINIFKFECNSNKIDQFYSLNLALFYNYIFYSQDCNQHKIQSKIKYQSFAIQQKIDYENTNDYYTNICCFLGQNINQNSNDSQQLQNLRFLTLTYELQNNNSFAYQKYVYTINSIIECIEHFQKYQKYSIINLLFTNDKFQNNSLLIVIKIDSRLFNKDNQFKIVFDVIEQAFPQNKLYKIESEPIKQALPESIDQLSPESIKKLLCDLPQYQVLNCVYETIKTYQHEQKLYFDLSAYEYFYDEIKQFIIKVNRLNNNQFIFKVYIHSNDDIESKFINDFSDDVEITKIDQFLIFQKKQQLPNQIIIKKIQIQIRLYDEQINDQQMQSGIQNYDEIFSEYENELFGQKSYLINNDIEDLEFENQQQSCFQLKQLQEISKDKIHELKNTYTNKSINVSEDSNQTQETQQHEMNKLKYSLIKDKNDRIDDINQIMQEQLLDYQKIKEFIQFKI